MRTTANCQPSGLIYLRDYWRYQVGLAIVGQLSVRRRDPPLPKLVERGERRRVPARVGRAVGGDRPGPDDEAKRIAEIAERAGLAAAVEVGAGIDQTQFVLLVEAGLVRMFEHVRDEQYDLVTCARLAHRFRNLRESALDRRMAELGRGVA